MATSKSPGRKRSDVKRRGPNDHQAADTLFATPGSDIVPGELIVQLDAHATQAITASIPSRGAAPVAGPLRFGLDRVDAALAKLGVASITRLHRPAPMDTPVAMAESVDLARTFHVRLTAGQDAAKAVAALSATAGVAYAEPVVYRETSVTTPNDPGFPSQWGLSKVRAPEAWDRTTGSPNIVVAVLDTGIDLDHPELAPLLVAGTDMVDLGPNPTPPPGFRFEGDWQGRDNVPQDEVGHGTHVAGTIACLSNNGQSVAGMTWNCRLMPVKVLTRIVDVANPARVRGVGSSADIAAGIRWAADHGARVINLSLGSATASQVERDAIAYAVARGVVVCAAMGNRGPAAGGPSFPAAFPDVIAVGATDVNDNLAVFSEVGPHIDVVAPGVGILSTDWDNRTSTKDGTSMASPHVAGLAALILSCNPSLTAVQVGDIIRQTAVPLRRQPADPVPNDFFGHGRIDAKAALDRACPTLQVTRLVSCRTVLANCPTNPVRCRSQLVACPTQQLNCPTRPAVCQATLPVTCRPTLALTCQTHPVACQVTRTIACPTRTPACVVSGTVACPTAVCGPSALVCGGPGDPGTIVINPGHGLGDEMGFDPYGADAGGEFDGEGWMGGDEGAGGCCGGR